mmetsp:Transcript_109319/g.352904  ORF Transcript_109319/g.352904 Transcript_109319/m.352904 type:complete len:259 (+) Transcript_109319:111-887(+)
MAVTLPRPAKRPHHRPKTPRPPLKQRAQPTGTPTSQKLKRFILAIRACLPRPRQMPPQTPCMPSTTANNEAIGVRRAVSATTRVLSLKMRASSVRKRNMIKPVASMKPAPRLTLSVAARLARTPSPAPMRFPTRIVAATEIPRGKDMKEKPAAANKMLWASSATSPTRPAATVMASKPQDSRPIIAPPASPICRRRARLARSMTHRWSCTGGRAAEAGGGGAGVQRAWRARQRSIASRARDVAAGAPTKPRPRTSIMT